MESFGVVGIDRRVIMNVETGMAPRKQQVDALFGDEVEVSEQCEDLMTKDELCFVGVDIGDGMPLPVREENPTCDDGVYMGIEFQRRPNVSMTATMPGRASDSSEAAAIISRTVS